MAKRKQKVEATEDRAGLLVRMPRDLKKRIAVSAAQNETNMNDTIVGILADHFGVTYAPSPGSRRRSPGASAAHS